MLSTLSNDELLRWLAPLVTAVVAAVVAAYLTMALTLRRVKREKRWDARHEAYKSILRSLHDIRFWADDTYADAKLLPAVGSAKREELRKRFDDAKHELWAHVHRHRTAAPQHEGRIAAARGPVRRKVSGGLVDQGRIPLIQSSTFFGPASPLFQVVGGAVIFAVLAIRVPNAVASRLSGGSTFGIANALRATS